MSLTGTFPGGNVPRKKTPQGFGYSVSIYLFSAGTGVSLNFLDSTEATGRGHTVPYKSLLNTV